MSDATEPSLAAARRRVELLYAPESFAAMWRILGDQLTEHFRAVLGARGRVLNWNLPADNRAVAGRWLDQGRPPALAAASAPAGAAETGEIDSHIIERFRGLVEETLSRGQNLHDPRYIGHQVPPPALWAGLFDVLGTVTNQVMAVYEMGPWATSVERALVERLGARLGFSPGSFAGLVTSGGSLGNLTALLTARNVVLRDSWERGLAERPTLEGGAAAHSSPGSSGGAAAMNEATAPVLVVQADAHYCIARSAGILGLGTKHIVRAPLDARRRMDPQQLDALLADLQRSGRTVVAVVACAGATPTGAFDPLEEIADVCGRRGAWLHVDAAHGGAAAFSGRHRRLLDGLGRADSVVCDAHKMLFVPALCAFVFYRNPAHRFEAFRQEAPYLFDPSAPGAADDDCGLLTIECTKRAAALGLWGLWSLAGPEIFGDLVDVTFAAARRLYDLLEEADDFTPLHEPEANIVVFRYAPREWRDAPLALQGQLNRELRRRLILSGRTYITQTTLDGAGALRCTVMHPLTGEAELVGLLGAIREEARRLPPRP